ncbi:MAG TPA: DUF692 domain-containing protein [Minicystis sp.]|nr:DUF692 domain-containing protein [Minicystis sp.]
MVQKHHGSGISLRKEHYESVLESTRRLDWIEMNPENFMSNGPWARRVIEQCAERMPVYAHGVCLSIGGPDPFRDDYMRELKELLDVLNPAYFSDHCCYASGGGIEFHDLLPMPFNEDAAKHIARRAREVQDRLERPLVLENISYYAEMPTSTMTEGQFISMALEEFDGGLLLDVNNIFVNAVNTGRPAREILRELPLHRARHIHLAGHKRVQPDLAIDDHGAAVIPEVWALYREAIELCGPIPTLIEWENNVPSWDRLLDEADTARRITEEVVAARKAQDVASAGVSP